MSQRFEGKNLEEALQSASQTLGVERWQLTYHVLLEKRGFLGGTKRVVIEAEVNASAPPPPAPAPLAPYDDIPSPRRERSPRAGRAGGGGRREGGRAGGRRGGRGDSRGGSRGYGRSDDRDLRVGDFETFLGDLPEQGPESDTASTVRGWIETTLSLARLDVVVRTEENDTQINVRLYGSDGRLLTDRHGELLDAVQVLANKALVGRKVEKEIELDCEEFKERRAEDIERKAFGVADRVRRNGREELLPPMSPVERRIVHIALRDDADVTTESRGEGFYKRVAIVLRSDVQESETSASASEAQPAGES